MKKVLSIILSVIVLISGCSVSFAAFAAKSPVATIISDISDSQTSSKPTTAEEIDIYGNSTVPITAQRPIINTSPTSPHTGNTGVGLVGIFTVSIIGTGIIVLAAKKKKISD